MQISNRVMIVTGGASGLGQATVEGFVEAGARAAIFDLNEEAGRELAARLKGAAIFCRVDVADEASVEAGISETLKAFSAIHLCMNCAGIGPAHKTLGREGPFPLALFRKAIDVNLIGTFNALRLAAREMAKNEPAGEAGERGVIINTASVAAFEGQVGQAAYSASKGGIVGMTLPIARDLAQYGIRVNTIAPGLIETPLLKGLPEQVVHSLVEMIQFPKRLGRPQEFAQLARSIVENPYLNGETIRLDGAIRMQPR